MFSITFSIKNNYIDDYLAHFTQGLLFFDQKKFTINRYKYIGIYLSNIGNCLLASFTDQSATKLRKYLSVEILNTVIDDNLTESSYSVENGKVIVHFLKNFQNPDGVITLKKIVSYFYLSHLYFLKRGRSLSASFQLRKILYLFRICLSNTQFNDANDEKSVHRHSNEVLLQYIKNYLLHPILRYTSSNAEYSDDHMLEKLLQTFDKENEPADEKPTKEAYFKNNLSNNSETREAIILYANIHLKLTGRLPLEYEGIISPYNIITTQYSRILELDLFSKFVYSKFKTDLAFYYNTPEKKVSSASSIVKNGTDYLYSLISLLRILNIYDKDFMMGFSYIAHIHFLIAKFIDTFPFSTPNDPSIIFTTPYKSIIQLIIQCTGEILGKSYYYSLNNASHHYKEAKSMYEKAIQLHTIGAQYHKTMDDIIYLEDDINDNAYHFGAALDRYLMINGFFATRINQCCP